MGPNLAGFPKSGVLITIRNGAPPIAVQRRKETSAVARKLGICGQPHTSTAYNIVLSHGSDRGLAPLDDSQSKQLSMRAPQCPGSPPSHLSDKAALFVGSHFRLSPSGSVHPRIPGPEDGFLECSMSYIGSSFPTHDINQPLLSSHSDHTRISRASRGQHD